MNERERGGARDRIDEQDGGISNQGNTFFKQEKKKRGDLKNEVKTRRGRRECFKEKTKRQR